MKARAAKLILGAAILMLPLLISGPLRAQVAVAALPRTVADASGAVVANGEMLVTSSGIRQSAATQTNLIGFHDLPNLTFGNYEVSVPADGFGTKLAKITFTGSNTLFLMNAALAAPQAQPQPPAENPPNAPSSNQTAPSLQDLGISPEQAQGNTQQQALLDKRTHMLKIHQRLGLITTVPLIATVVASMGAGGRSTSASSRDLHVALGGLTGDLYCATAYYAIRAPKVPGTETRGPIRFHKAMAWIHGPGMILTPILGAIAFDQKSKGEKVHGIASAHGPVAIVTAGAFGAAVLSVSFKF
jgi:hypothetical protein